MPAHLAAPAPVNGLRRTVLAILASCAAFGAAIVIALAAAGGTFAYFSSTTPLSAGTVTAGTSGLTIQNVTSYPITGLDATALMPGASVFTSTPLTVANTGTATLSVTQGAASFGAVDEINGHLVISVGRVSNATTTCTAGAGTALGSGYTLPPMATMKVCVTVTLSVSSPGTVAGQTTSFTIPLDGAQVSSMIKRIAAALGAIVFLVAAGTSLSYAYWVSSATTTATVASANPVVTNCSSIVALQNGGFETASPALPDNSWTHASTLANWTSRVPGTTTARPAEVWRGSVVSPILPASGAQNIELNSTDATTLYQEVATVPGQVLRWGFWHRGRDSATVGDTVKLTLGAPTANAADTSTTTSTSPTLAQIFTTTRSAWVYYTVPTRCPPARRRLASA